MPSSVSSTEERESQVLRASVVEAAFSLGPKVANLIFDTPIAEEDEPFGSESSYPILTPGLTSASSVDSHSTGFSSHDGHRGFGRSSNEKRSHPEISIPLPLGTASKTTLEEGFYLNSPFVVVDDPQFLPSTTTVTDPTAEPQTPRRKKSLKVFRFTPRKRNKDKVPVPLPVEQSTNKDKDTNKSKGKAMPKPLLISAPFKIFGNLDDPVDSTPPSPTPSFSPRPATPPSTSPSNTLNTSRLTPSKLRKQLSRQRDWDFKDPDRPSFFIDQSYVTLDAKDAPPLPRRSASVTRPKGGTRSRPTGDDEDLGYVSEGTGLRFRNKKKSKDNSDDFTGIRNLSSRMMRNWSSTDLKKDPAPSVPRPQMTLPIAAKFARYNDPSSPDSTFDSPRTENSPYLSAERETFVSSTSSFAHMPDLNAVKRLGLDKYASIRGDGAIGADNDIKLEMLARLLAERPIPRLEAEDMNQRIRYKRKTVYEEFPDIQRTPSQTTDTTNSTDSRRGRRELPRGGESEDRDLQWEQEREREQRQLAREYERDRRELRSRSQSRPRERERERPEARSRSRAPPVPSRRDFDYGYQAVPNIRRVPNLNISFAAATSVRSTSPVRGKEQPFPVKSILRNVPRVQPTDRKLLYVPARYEGLLDVPRSVKSSYSRDLEREEFEDEQEEQEEEEDDNDSLSQYSRYTKYIDEDEDAASRASFMDVEKSGRARKKLVGGIFGGERY